MKLLSIPLLVLASFQVSAQTEPAFTFEGVEFFQSGNELEVKDARTGERFTVNRREITVKPAAAYNATEIQSFIQNQGLVTLRTARTGFSDLLLAPDQDYFQTLTNLKNSGLFEVVEHNTFGRYTFVPNDTQYGSQWHLPNVSAEQAWDINSGSANIAVAVLDSGTEFTHSDLGTGSDSYNNIWINPGEDAWSDPEDPNTGNGIDDDNNGFVDDWKGWDFDNDDNDGSGAFFHGTAVAGVLAAKTNNNNGVAGMAGGNNAQGISIMIGNVGNNAPNGSVLDDAILYAADNGARIIQLSLSVGTSAAIDAALEEAYVNQGLLVINASGNGGGGSVSYPGSNDYVMAVGATNQSDTKVGFSQFGPKLEVAAPGVDMVTTTLNNQYTSTDGTSFAAPLTSGVAAVLFSQYPSLTNEQVRFILQDSADKTGPYDYNHDPEMPGRSLELGYGRVNAHSALLLAQGFVTDIIFRARFEGDLIFEDAFELMMN